MDIASLMQPAASCCEEQPWWCTLYTVMIFFLDTFLKVKCLGQKCARFNTRLPFGKIKPHKFPSAEPSSAHSPHNWMLLFKTNFCQLYMQRYVAVVLIYIFFFWLLKNIRHFKVCWLLTFFLLCISSSYSLLFVFPLQGQWSFIIYM